MIRQRLLNPIHDRMGIGHGKPPVDGQVQVSVHLMPKPPRLHVMNILHARDVHGRVFEFGQD